MKNLKKLEGKTVYEDLAIQKILNKTLKHMTISILNSSLDDADIEFLTNDYDEWKSLRLKRKKKSETFTEFELKQEFEYKQNYKDTLFDIIDSQITVSDIPEPIMQQRKLFEENKLENLAKITNYQFDTLNNIAKLHGWKIGVDYVEPTIFDL